MQALFQDLYKLLCSTMKLILFNGDNKQKNSLMNFKLNKLDLALGINFQRQTTLIQNINSLVFG